MIYELEDKEKLEAAAEAIMEGFTWSRTKEGYDYWREVHNNLLGIISPIKIEEVCPTCGHVKK